MNNFFRKVRNKLKDYFDTFIIKFSLFLNSPWLTAVFFVFLSREINNSGSFTVLCMRRSIFMDDITAMAEFSGKINYRILNRGYFNLILTHFTGDRERAKISESNYHNSNYGREGKEKYRLYLDKMFPVLKKFINFKAVLVAHYGYVEQQEFVAVCNKYRMPFIVLYKEGMVSPGTHNQWALKAHKGYKFTQAKMLVYNTNIMNAILCVNVPGLTLDKIKVVGIPRTDRYFHRDSKQNKSLDKQIVLFSAYFYDKLSTLLPGGSQQQIEAVMKKFEEFHKIIMDFALKHPDIKVVIKTKIYKKFFDYVNDIYKKYFREKINNLTITSNADSIRLIKDSKVVIGFGSTTLIEALAAGKTIISFDFGDLLADDSFDYFRSYPGLVNYAKNKQDLEEFILNYEKYNHADPALKQKFLEEFLYMPDGHSSSRAESEIIKAIDNYLKS